MFNPFEYPLVATGLGLVVGWFAGIYSKVVSDKLTDRRRDQETKAKLLKKFNDCRQPMPKLLEEMAVDLSQRLAYEFVLLDVNLIYGGFTNDPLFYLTDRKKDDDYIQEKRKAWVHKNLLNKVRMLEKNGFVEEVSTTNVPRFRMSEQFVQLIKSEVPLPAEPSAPAGGPPQ